MKTSDETQPDPKLRPSTLVMSETRHTLYTRFSHGSRATTLRHALEQVRTTCRSIYYSMLLS
eukprot:4514321-Amphidinium_carterae.1